MISRQLVNDVILTWMSTLTSSGRFLLTVPLMCYLYSSRTFIYQALRNTCISFFCLMFLALVFHFRKVYWPIICQWRLSTRFVTFVIYIVHLEDIYMSELYSAALIISALSPTTHWNGSVYSAISHTFCSLCIHFFLRTDAFSGGLYV